LADNPVLAGNLLMMILSMFFAGVATFIRDIHSWIVPGLVLHYALVTAQGLCYLASIGVGSITIYKFLKERKKHGHK
jgi:hypothetical protein